MSTDTSDELVRAYLAHGWALVPIPMGKKGPVGIAGAGWNLPEKCVVFERNWLRLKGQNLGLAHAYSRTCAVDVDDYERAIDPLAARGIDLDALLTDARAVQIRSGKPNRAKLLYRLPEGVRPLGSVKLFGSALELRCGTRDGLTVQDVLPPSIHPETGKPYEWAGMGHWEHLPMLPDKLLELWRAGLDGSGTEPAEASVLSVSAEALRDLRSALAAIPADEYDMWIRIGHALKPLGDAGRGLWVEWSQSSEKFKPTDARRWEGFHPTATGYEAVFAEAQRRGWLNPASRAARLPPSGGNGGPPDEPPPPEYDGSAGEPESIQISGGSLPANVDAAERALIRSQPNLFIHGNRLVRIAKWDAAPGILRRWTGASVLCEVSANWMVEALTRGARWERFDKRSDEWRICDAPKRVAETLLAREGEWRFKRLAGFLEAPVVGPKGRVIDQPGYDAETGLYLAGDLRIRPIGKPTRADARAAAKSLGSLVETFTDTFSEPRDLSATLAAMLTAIQRRVLPTAPFFGISASTPATGKSLLADCIAALATGRVASAMALGQDGPELEKRIDAALLDADPLILIDNVDRAVRSDVLCQVATQMHKTVRVLGQTRKIEAPTNICWLLTGNNLTVLGDLTRRVCMIHLDARCERPERRKFQRDALSHILRHRAEGVRDALVLVKAYLDAGLPDVDLSPIGSFEGWDRMVRRPLVWAGLPDPLDTERDLREEDHEYVAIRDLLQQWRQVFGGEPITAAQLLLRAKQGAADFSGQWMPDNPGLHDAVASLLGDGARANAQALGYKLRAWQSRIVDGLRVVRASDKGKAGVRWLVSNA